MNQPRSNPCPKTIAAALLSLALTGPNTATAIGFYLPNQDPVAIGRANAFAATADNPSAIFYNPAGITQIPGGDVQLNSINYLGVNASYDPAVGNGADTKFELTPVPQIFATYSLSNQPVSFGFGLYAPFGLGVEWPSDSSLRTLAIESRMHYLTFNPVIAWKPHPTLSIGGGPTINWSDLKLRRGLLSPVDEYQFKGEAWSLGYTFGILWQPVEKWSFAASYRSAAATDYKGNSKYLPGDNSSVSIPTSTRVVFPQTATLGVSYRPSAHWNFEANVDWINWHPISGLTLKGTGALFGSDLPFDLRWHDSWQFKFGGTYYFTNGWFLSAGYFYSTDTTSSEFFTPAVPDTDLHTGTIGFGHNGERWHWAVAGQLIAGPEREIAATAGNSNPFTGATAAGKYQLIIPAISFSVGYRF